MEFRVKSDTISDLIQQLEKEKIIYPIKNIRKGQYTTLPMIGSAPPIITINIFYGDKVIAFVDFNGLSYGKGNAALYIDNKLVSVIVDSHDITYVVR